MTKFLLTVNYDGGAIDTPMDEWAPEDVKAHMDYYGALNAELTHSGELVEQQALTGPELVKVVTSGGATAPVQEALLSAALHWPRDGTPDNPRGWLIQTGSRKLLDQMRSEQARRRRESERVPGAGSDDGPADQPREAADQGVGRAVPDAGPRGMDPTAALGSACALPGLQRGVRQQHRR